MLSRVAENLYWIGRYVERVENLARLLDESYQLELDTGLLVGAERRSPLEQVLTILACREQYEATYADAGPESMLRFLTFDRLHQQSILGMIARARENARGTQDSLSAEAWSHLNRLYLMLTGARAERAFTASQHQFYDRIKRGCILFDGLVDATMPRAEAYYFLQVGRYLERIDMLSRILNVWFTTQAGAATSAQVSLRPVHWASLLRSCSAYETYLKEYQEHVEAELVAHFLVLNSEFPRAMRFCVRRCFDALRTLAGLGDEGGGMSPPERVLGRLDSDLRYKEIGEIFSEGLPVFLQGVQDMCSRAGTEIQHAYFLN